MYNVLVVSSLNVSLSLNPSTKTVSKIVVTETDTSLDMFSYLNFETILVDKISGIDDVPPKVLRYSMRNISVSTGNRFVSEVPGFVPHYSDDEVKLLTLNYSAISMSPSLYSVKTK